jgi:D-alanine-D-alanine ligase
MNTPDHKTVLLVFGGESPEHDVSLKSATNVLDAIDKTRFSIICCYIDRQGRWWSVDGATPNHRQSPRIEPILGGAAVRIGSHSRAIDVLFPILHGQNGEDGTIQGLARMAHIPIVGCDIDGSAICIDKITTKRLLEQSGLPIVPYEVCHISQTRHYVDIQSKLRGDTFFVKPARQGSSVGISKANTPAGFEAALAEAFQHDTKVIIEPAMQIREIEVAVMGATLNPSASIPGEIIPDRDFYSYESKYASDSASTIKIPANLSPAITSQIQIYARQAFTTLHCRGLARIDFFVDTDNTVYINEINTLPGFTSISMYPKLWEASGVPYQQLITALIDLALHDA